MQRDRRKSCRTEEKARGNNTNSTRTSGKTGRNGHATGSDRLPARRRKNKTPPTRMGRNTKDLHNPTPQDTKWQNRGVFEMRNPDQNNHSLNSGRKQGPWCRVRVPGDFVERDNAPPIFLTEVFSPISLSPPLVNKAKHKNKVPNAHKVVWRRLKKIGAAISVGRGHASGSAALPPRTHRLQWRPHSA